MTRKEFINAWCDLIDERRRKLHPGLRPSERAMARVSDQRNAERQWRQNGGALRQQSVADLVADLMTRLK